MISQSKLSIYRSLKQKKFRQIHELFIVEGKKSVLELLGSSFEYEHVLIKSGVEPNLKITAYEELNSKDFDKISNFKSADGFLAIAKVPKAKRHELNVNSLYLDGINDPGNLGTMLRIADWYGITQVICSSDSVDAFNPKTVAASMGSVFRVSIIYDEGNVLKSMKENCQLLGSSLKGNSNWNLEPKKPYVLIIGSESHGMRADVESQCDELIKLEGRGKAESLNAAVACGILLDRLSSNKE